MIPTIQQKLILVAKNIRQIRLSKYYSQEYLGAKLNVSQNTYSKIELGYVKLSFERLLKIADILEVDITELLKLTE